MTNSEPECLGATLPPLFRTAAIAGVKAVVALHLQRGVDVNATDDKGRSALILAVEKGHTEICRMLLEAGADPALRDDEGNDALSIAVIHSLENTENLLRQYLPHSSPEPVQEPVSCPDASALTYEGEVSILTGPEIVTGTGEAIIEVEDFDLSLWEEEEDTPKPTDDASCLLDAKEIQKQISRHVPLDTDEDWSDVDIDLPEIFKFKRRVEFPEDSDWQPAIRHLLLSGLRYGWVTEGQLIAAVPADEKDLDSPDAACLTALRVVLEDLGIELEDIPDDFSAPSQEGEEYDGDQFEIDDDLMDLLVDEAIYFFFDLLSYNDDSLTLYFKDIGPKKILSRDEEISLVSEINEGLREALGAIPWSPAALNELFDRLKKAERGEIPIRSIINAGSNVDENFPDHDEPNLEDEYDTNDLAYGTLGIPLAPGITSEIQLKFELIRNIHNAMAGVSSRSEREILADKLKDALYAINPSSEFRGHLWRKVKSDTSHSQAQEILARGLNRAKSAKNVLATSNLRLAFWVARKYRGLPLMDLVQEGNIGILKAIDRYDPSYGAKFSTYAKWWIRQSIIRAKIDKQQVIRLPAHISDDLRKVNAAINALTSRLGRAPTTEELSLDTDISEIRIQNILSVINGPLQTTAIEDLDYSLEETVEDLNTSNAEDFVTKIELKEAIKEAVESLTAKEAIIIKLRFGLDDDNDYTLEEIGQLFGVSRERIRQIEMKALSRLAHPTRSKKLRPFLEETSKNGETEQ